MAFAKLFSVLLLMTIVAPASGQYEAIVLKDGSIDTDCNIRWIEAGARFSVFHYSTNGAAGSQFRVPRACFNASTIVGPFMISTEYPYTGDIETGIRFDYGACLTGWVYLMSVSYADELGVMWYLCCEQPVWAHPDATTGQPEAFDCSGNPVPAYGFSGMVTVDPVCTCPVPAGVDVQENTWGAIKAIYRAQE